MNKSQNEKWRRVLAGEKVVCSYADLDAFPYHGRLASIQNPRQVGTLDCWLAYLKK